MNDCIPLRPALAGGFALALLAATAAPAQTTVGATESAPPRDEEIVKLSEFTVSAGSQSGYIASESMTGSRIPTKIKDLPYNVDIVTSEFLDDYLIVDPSVMLNAGVVTLDQDAGNSYTVRGIPATGQLYNGFWQPSGIPVATALVDRREVLKGPSAGAYGQSAPGGMVNLVPKQPKSTPQQSVQLATGSDDSRQARLTSTGPLTSRTSYLAILEYDQRGFNQPLHFNKNRTAAFSVLHKFGDDSTIKVDLILAGQRNNSPSNRVPYIFNSKQPTPIVTKNVGYFTGYDLALENINATGPLSYKNNDNYSAFGVYEKRLSDIFSLRVGGDVYANNTRSFNTSDITAYDPNPADKNSNPYNSSFYGLVRFRNAGSSYTAPSYKVDNKDGGGGQLDLLAHYPMFHGNVDNRTLLTVDFSTMYDFVLKKGMPQQGTLSSDGSSVSTKNAVDTTIIPAAPQFAGDTSYWVPVIDPTGPIVFNDPTTGFVTNIYNVPLPSSSQYITSSWQKNRTDDFGLMLRHQATLWRKLLLYGSLRFDNVMYNNFTLQYPSFSKDYHPTWATAWQNNFNSKNTNPISHYHSDAFTPGFGTSYRVTPEISMYGNYSQSFKASVQQVTGATTGSYFLPNERAVGYDYGVKAGLLQDRLNFTAGGFYILQKNMSVTTTDELGNTTKEASGTVTSKGVEVTANYIVNDAIGLNAGWYHTNAKWGNTGADLDLQNRSKSLVPPDIITASTTYKFPGRLKGLRFFAKYQYASPTHAEDGGGQTMSGTFAVDGQTHTGSYTPIGSNNGLRNIVITSYYTVDAGLSYDFKLPFLSRHMSNRLQFNVDNVFDRHYVTYSRGVGDNRMFELSDRITF